MPKRNAVARALKILELLAGHFADGLSNKEIAEALDTSAVNASRDMALLGELGWAKKMDTGRWVLSVKQLAIARSYAQQLDNLQSRMAETERNIAAAAMRYGG